MPGHLNKYMKSIFVDFNVPCKQFYVDWKKHDSMKETQMPPVHATNMVESNGNIAYVTESIVRRAFVNFSNTLPLIWDVRCVLVYVNPSWLMYLKKPMRLQNRLDTDFIWWITNFKAGHSFYIHGIIYDTNMFLWAHQLWQPGPRLNIKTVFPGMGFPC